MMQAPQVICQLPLRALLTFASYKVQHLILNGGLVIFACIGGILKYDPHDLGYTIYCPIIICYKERHILIEPI